MEILIGADPEFFVRNKKTNELISAHGLIAGTKKEPIPMGPGHAQVDGMALEINVPPAKNAKEFIDGFKGVMNALQKELPDVTFDFSPVAHFGADVIKNQPREARELGCEPDFNAYNAGKPFPRPNADTPFRTASGHVHIGWTNEQDVGDPDHIEACIMLSKQLDFMLGLPSLVWDEDVTRRQLYGKAGCYRPKHYGMEYRTMSNAWLTDDERIKFVVEQSIDAFQKLTLQLNLGTVRGTNTYIDKGDWKSGFVSYVGHINSPHWLSKLYKDRVKAVAEALAKNMPNVVDAQGTADLASIVWQQHASFKFKEPAQWDLDVGFGPLRGAKVAGRKARDVIAEEEMANAFRRAAQLMEDNIAVAAPPLPPQAFNADPFAILDEDF